MIGRLIAIAICATVTCAGLGSPTFAKKTIELPSNAKWQHSRSGLVLPTKIGDVPRISVTDYSQSEFNVAAQYQSENSEATLYIYRPYWPNVAAWFERSEQAIFSDKSMAKPTPQSSSATAFARPNGSVSSGLRQLYTYGAGTNRTSALAILPYGGWLLKIRYSTTNSSLAEADIFLDQIIKSVKFPNAASEGQAVEQIQPCTETFKWKKAAIIKPDMTSVLLAATSLRMIVEVGNGNLPSANSVCKVAGSNDRYSLYHDLNDDTKFWMLILDAGATAQISKGQLLFEGSKQYWSTLSIDSQHILLPVFSRMPEPDQWFSVLMSGQGVASVEFDPDAPKDEQPKTDATISK